MITTTTVSGKPGQAPPEHGLDETTLPRITVPQHDTTTLVVLGLVALHPGSGFEQPDDGRAYRHLFARGASLYPAL